MNDETNPNTGEDAEQKGNISPAPSTQQDSKFGQTGSKLGFSKSEHEAFPENRHMSERSGSRVTDEMLELAKQNYTFGNIAEI